MPANKKTQQERFKLLRNAVDPFVLYLEDEPYILTEEGLKGQVDTSIQKKRNWDYPTIKFISLQGQILKLRISNREVSYELTVKIEPDKLHISCSCGCQAQTLCNHAYQTLKKLIAFERTDYFKRYAPKGLIEIALTNKKHFKIEPNETGLYIKPSAALGNIYKIADKMGGVDLNGVLNLPQQPAQQETIRVTDLTYIILYSSRDSHFPFLLPCLGILNKAGTDIKGFYNFILDTLNEYDAVLTNDQKELNGLCYEMRQEIKNGSGSIIDCDPEQTSCAVNIFNLWNKALPILHQQSFIYRYNFYYKIQLTGRPEKGRLQRISLSREKPLLHFQLNDKGAFYQLEMNVSIKGKNLKHFDTVSTFFICNDKNLYLLSSLKDVGITQWMRRCHNRITVFKEHFTEFKKEYLDPLCNHYPLKITNSQK
ncbi:hypothetical protein A3860_35010 [Niastella vici]|uniref:SWIM-type domain-containing protein n=1 Tax=Niastella vici TaxID=1703345 RepID=A0A1V9FNQ2_9BACT|nr:hypothetical protein [Niastella vici]OQP59985.1 hypothetical protein A3860_35010 [Niastella vici]